MPMSRPFLGFLSAVCLMFALLTASSAAEAANATVRRDVHLRTGPGSGFGRILTVPQGTRLSIRDCSAGWCRVKVFGTGGYVPDEALRGAYRSGYRPPAEIIIGRPHRDHLFDWDDRHHHKPPHWDKPHHHKPPKAKPKRSKHGHDKVKHKKHGKG